MHVTVLSPHRDDAAFSCGLLLHGLLASGAEVSIVNVCTVSSYAPYLDIDDQDRVQQVTLSRREEDESFARTLLAGAERFGSKVEFVDLAWLDAPLRWSMAEEQVLADHPLREDEVVSLSSQLRTLPQADVVLAPLALGGHLDHRLVHEAASRTFTVFQLVFYEDLPYACRLPASENEVLHSKKGRSAYLLPPAGAQGIKRRLALCYGTQVGPEVTDELEDYAATLGGKERFYGMEAPMERLTETAVNVPEPRR